MNEKALAIMEPTQLGPVVGAETSTAAQSAMVRAQVEARCLVAMKMPRNLDQVRVDLLRDCRHTPFAEQALYKLPFGRNDEGKPITGLSIRFAEAALDSMGNIDVRTITIYEDAEKVILNCTVTDLERNASYSTDIAVSKTVEKKKVREGERPISSRLNSYGELVYLLPATEVDLRRKQAAEISKIVRTNGLRLMPAWLKEECLEQIRQTLQSEAASDPDATRRKLVDAFAVIGVQPRDLATYLGHDIGGANPAELVDLRTVYAAVRDGVCTWHELLVAKTGVERDADPDANAELREKLAAVRDRLAQGRSGSGKRPSDPGQTPQVQPPAAPATGAKTGKGTRRAKGQPEEPTSSPVDPDVWERDHGQDIVNPQTGEVTS